jgi:hypothetical protein
MRTSASSFNFQYRSSFLVFTYVYLLIVGAEGTLAPHHIQWNTHATLSKTPLDKWSARHTDLYLTTNNIYKRQTSIHTGGIQTLNPSNRAAVEPTPKTEWPQVSAF